MPSSRREQTSLYTLSTGMRDRLADEDVCYLHPKPRGQCWSLSACRSHASPSEIVGDNVVTYSD